MRKKAIIIATTLLSLLFLLYGAWWLIIHTKPGFDDIKIFGHVKNKSKPINEVEIKITYWSYNDSYIAVDSTRILKTNDQGYYETIIKNAESIDIEARYKNNTIKEVANIKSEKGIQIDFNFEK